MPTYLFRDEFETAESAPIDDPRSAEPGPGSWDVTDTNNRLSITEAGAAQLIASGEMEWNDPGIWTASALDGTDIGAVFLVVRPRGHAHSFAAFLAESQAPANPQNNSFGFRMRAGSSEDVGPQLSVPLLFEGNGTTPAYIGIPGTHVRSIDYGITLIPRDGGGFWFLVSGGRYGVFPNARRTWIGVSEEWVANLWLGITGNTGVGGSTFEVSSARVIAKADLPAQWNDRLFSAIDGDEFGGSGGINNRELEIGNLTWALADSGVDGTVSGGSVTNAGNFFAYVNKGVNDHVFEVTWTQGAVDDNNANRFVGIILRGTGTAQSNFYRIAWFANTGDWVLFDGASTNGLSQSGLAPVIGQDYTLRAYDNGSLVQVYLLVHSTNTWRRIFNNTIAQSGTRFGFYSGTNDRSVLHEFAVWEREQTIELPAVLGPVLPISDLDDTIYASDFEVGSDQSLAGFDTDALNPSGWQVDHNRGSAIAFTMHSATNEVGIDGGMPTTGGSFQMVASRDVDSVDHSAETVIHLESTAAQNYMTGLAVRYADMNNWIIARHLEQGNGADLGNEIECWQRVAGGTPFLLPMVNLRTLYQENDTCRMRVDAVGDQLYIWHATGEETPLELVSQGHIDSGLMTQTRCGIAVNYSTGFGGGDPRWDEVTLSEASVTAAEPDPAEITWITPEADSTISGMTQLQVQTSDERVVKVQFEVNGTPIGDPVDPDE